MQIIEEVIIYYPQYNELGLVTTKAIPCKDELFRLEMHYCLGPDAHEFAQEFGIDALPPHEQIDYL